MYNACNYDNEKERLSNKKQNIREQAQSVEKKKINKTNNKRNVESKKYVFERKLVCNA